MSKVKLGDVAIESREVYKGDKSGMPIVGLEHLTPEDVILSNWDHDTENTFTKMFRKGDMLFGRRRAYLKKAALAPFDGICSGDITVIRTKEGKLLPDLLPFIIQNENLFDFAVGKSAGSLSPRVKWENLQNFAFELPTLDEQKKLAAVLWSINDTQQAYQNLLKQTDELVKARFVEMFGNPIINDKGWATKLLKVVAPEYKPNIPEQKEYWWLNLDMIETYSGSIIEKVTDSIKNIGNSTAPFDNTMVLYSKLRPYLNKLVVPDSYGYATTELVGMKPNESVLNKYFLFNLLRGDQFVIFANGLSAGGQMPRMPMKALREFPCILPPMELQEQFVKFFKQSDKSKVALQNAIIAAQETKRSIIAGALGITGKE